MNFLSIRYFLAVAEEKNITKAAETLYISQQSLSNQILKLEKEMGVRLFERAPDFALTFAGRKFKSAAEKMQSVHEELFREMEDIKSNISGEIRLGISHTRGRAVLPEILPEFRATHPLVEIRLTESHSDELSASLRRGEIDIMIGFAPVEAAQSEVLPLVRDRLFLVVPKAFTESLYGARTEEMRRKFSGAVDVGAFANFPFILLTRKNRLRDILDQYCRRKNIPLNIILETENSETTLALAMKGMGITVYPEMFLPTSNTLMREKADNTVDFFPLPEEETAGLLVLAYSRERYLTKAAQDFVALAEKKLVKRQKEKTQRKIM